MSSADRLALAYARFINFSASVRQLTGSSALDAAEENDSGAVALAFVNQLHREASYRLREG